MTKPFCELCGEPAEEHRPKLKVNFPDMQWRGLKTSQGSTSSEGTWTPYVEARFVFEGHDMPRSSFAMTPDLCSKCIADLLRKAADSLKTKATP